MIELFVLLGKGVALAKRVPRIVWLVLALIALLIVAYLLHQHKAKEALQASYTEGYNAANAEWAEALQDARKDAAQWKAKAEARQAEISAEIGERHEEDLRRNAAAADALRLRGPGQAAACPRQDNHSGVSAGAGGPVEASPGGNAPGASVPAENGLAVVPWGWLVARGEDLDALRSEVLAWRDWWKRQNDLNQRSRSE